MKSPILDIQNVTKVYQDRNKTVRALNGVSLTINRGEIFGLLGVNGAGKTTLSSLLATLHPVTSGTILFNGVSIYDDLLRYRKALGFCPQKQNLDPDLTVYENLLFAGRYFLMPEHEIKEYYLQCGIKLKDVEANKLYSYTEGWISALYLLMLDYKNE